MADNVTIPTTGSGTATPLIATDDVASVHYQKVKLALGADGAIDTLLDSGQQLAANSAPVVLASDHSDIKITLDGESVVISGTVQVQSNSANLATQATLALIQTAVELLTTAVAESAFNVGITAGGPIGAATDPEATGDGTVIGVLKRIRSLLGGTLTITGAVSQSGTWDEVGVNDSGNSLTVDAPVGTPVFVRLSDGAAAITTLPVSLASVPSHAVTNAGTFAVQVDGAALTALQLIDNLVLAEDAAHGTSDPGVQALAVRKDSGAAIAGTDGDYSPLQVDASGNLRVNVAAGGAGDGAILDGVSSSIKATVLDYTNSNPLAVRLTDTAGDYVGAGAGTQYTEDAAAAANPVGTALILVREDARAGTLTSADRDNVAARGNNKGELYVKDTDAAALLTTIDTDTGAIASTVDALAGALASVATDALTANIITGETGVAGGTGNAGANTIRVVSAADDPAVATLDNIYLSLGAGAGTDLAAIVASAGNQVVSLGIMDDWDETDRAKVNIIAGQAGVTAGAGAVAANTPRVTLASDDPAVVALQALDNAISGSEMQVDIVTVPAPLSTAGGGTEATALRVTIASDSTGILSVDDNGGSLTIDGTVTASNATGNVAHDAADSGNPIKTGGVAYNFDGSAPGTPVAEGDRANHITDVYGRPFVETTHPNYWTASADYASAQTNASIKAAPGAGLKLYITDVIISNGATAGNVTLLDGSGGTVKLEIYPGINGGLAQSFRTPIALTANTALCITSTTVTTHSVTVCGYTAP